MLSTPERIAFVILAVVWDEAAAEQDQVAARGAEFFGTTGVVIFAASHVAVNTI